MNLNIDELEKVLNEEIDVCLNIEKYVIEKKQYLVKGDIDNLKKVDSNLEEFSLLFQKVEEDRKNIMLSMDKPDMTLKELISMLEEEKDRKRLRPLENKIKNIANNVKKQNSINFQLIQHALKLIEASFIAATETLLPELSAYNNCGKKNKNINKMKISSVSHEA